MTIMETIATLSATLSLTDDEVAEYLGYASALTYRRAIALRSGTRGSLHNGRLARCIRLMNILSLSREASEAREMMHRWSCTCRPTTLERVLQ